MTETLRDPVCQMTVTAESPHHANVDGTDYWFCCAGCRDRFVENPSTFLHPPEESSPTPAGAEERLYTCPMHPEVEQLGPGACPLCGMALEPAVFGVDDAEDPELVDARRRFWICLTLSAPLMFVAMRGLPGVSAFATDITQLVLATPVVIWGGWPFFRKAVASLRHRSPNMFTLIGLGVTVSYLYSLVGQLAPQIFPAEFRTPDDRVKVYFESAAVIVTLVLLGQWLELRARRQTGDALRSLLSLTPPVALRIHAGQPDEEIPLAEVRVDDTLRIRPGDAIPVDGVVVDGTSSVVESMVTGEPMPNDKTAGDPLIAGTMNGEGAMAMRATRVGADTLLAQIVQKVAQAQRTQAPVQALADQVAAWFVPAVTLVAVASFVVWWMVGPSPKLAYATVAAVAVLIIACPCALGLATPMSIMVAMGRGARHGILFRDARSLQRLRDVDTLILDKTGTLTQGTPSVVSVAAVDSMSEPEIVYFAASVERSSAHPLATAMVEYAGSMPLAEASEVETTVGLGVRGMVDGKSVVLGNRQGLAREGIAVGAHRAESDAWAAEGMTVVYLAVDYQLVGMIGFRDDVRPEAASALKQWRTAGLRVVMATGDQEAPARRVAEALGIETVFAEVRPDGKAEVVQKLQEQGATVAMVGDGINDAPALAQADVGIAMGSGSDIALSTASVTLVEGDLARLESALRLSRQTMHNIRQNLWFAFLYNGLGVPLAAGVLYPWLGWLLSPMVAAAAMSFSSLSVVANALRLRKTRL